MASLQFSYTLTEQETYDGLKKSGAYKLTGKRALIESVLLGIFFLFFLVSYVTGRKGFDLALTVICGVMFLVLVFLPRMDMRRQARQGHKEVTLRISPQKLVVQTEAGEQAVDLDGTAVFKVVGKPGVGSGQLVTGSFPKGGLLILPVESIPKGIRGQVLSALLGSGQQP